MTSRNDPKLPEWDPEKYPWGEGPAFETVTCWTCEACGKKANKSPNEAYVLGWDTAPYFTGYTKCETCNISKTNLFKNKSNIERW